MAFDFPNSPTVGTIYAPAGGPSYVWDGVAWKVAAGSNTVPRTADSFNRLVNGDFLVSQENGITAGSVNSYYFADQWRTTYSGAMVLTANQVSAAGGSPSGVSAARIVVSTADTSITGSDLAALYHPIEGIVVEDLLWGFAGLAKPIVVCFDMYSSVAGTFSLSIRNDTATHSYVVPFTVSVGWNYGLTFAIPGPTVGTWLAGSTQGIAFCIALAAGSTYTTSTAGAWVAGNFLAHTSITNNVGAVNNEFRFTKMGLYADPDGTGLAPPWTPNDWSTELLRCRRYYAKYGFEFIMGGYHGAAGQALYNSFWYQTSMRSAATVSFISPATSNSSGFNISTQGNDGCRLYITNTAIGAMFVMCANIVANSRM